MPLIPVTYGGDTLTARNFDGDAYTIYFDHEDSTPVQSLVDPSTPSGIQPLGSSSTVELLMSEEFNSAMELLDAETGHVRFRATGYPWATWYPEWPRFTSQSPGGAHTNTNQGAYYDTSKVSVGGGSLHLACHQQTTGGLPYTAGMVTSKDTFEREYGWYEARIAINGTRNGRHWPAWWMACSIFNLWPPEIDIWELFGTANEYLTNVYRTSGGNTIEHESFSDFASYHVYTVHWTADEITFYRDGVQTYTTAASVNGPQYLILNNGAEWPEGAPAPTGTMPTVEVDYIRAWAE